MTKLMEEAIDSLRRDVPAGCQDDVARAVMRLTGKDPSIYQLTPDDEADLDEADAEIARGEFATDEQVLAMWAKHALRKLFKYPVH
jgi:hypothetical protein